MSAQVRNRVAALLLGGVLLGAPVLTGGAASAAPVKEATRQVTFSGGGGMLGISCNSHPDVESLTVPAESTVRVVNHTGHDANLQLSGETKGMLESESSTEVVFRRGTTAVTLTPNCSLDNDSQPVMVTASPSVSATTPDPTPVPSVGDSSASVGEPSSTTDSSRADTGAPNDHPQLTSAGIDAADDVNPLTASVISQTAAAAGKAIPRGVGNLPVKDKTVAVPHGAAGPAFSGMPGGGEQKALLPGVRTDDVTPPVAAGDLETASTPATDSAAAEPVAEMAPMPQRKPIGLLGVIASVCVLGVGIAAIRAIVSQRANRANMT